MHDYYVNSNPTDSAESEVVKSRVPNSKTWVTHSKSKFQGYSEANGSGTTRVFKSLLLITVNLNHTDSTESEMVKSRVPNSRAARSGSKQDSDRCGKLVISLVPRLSPSMCAEFKRVACEKRRRVRAWS